MNDTFFIFAYYSPMLMRYCKQRAVIPTLYVWVQGMTHAPVDAPLVRADQGGAGLRRRALRWIIGGLCEIVIARFPTTVLGATPTVHLNDLTRGMPGLTPARGAMMAEAAAVCLNEVEHQSGCELFVSDVRRLIELLEWNEVTPQHIATYADLQEATEHGAYGMAILYLANSMGLTVLERSVKGPGFDYWMGNQDDEDALPFQNTIRLEVSGILRGDDAQVRTRARLKVTQVRPSNDMGAARIVIVEFSKPCLRVDAV